MDNNNSPFRQLRSPTYRCRPWFVAVEAKHSLLFQTEQRTLAVLARHALVHFAVLFHVRAIMSTCSKATPGYEPKFNKYGWSTELLRNPDSNWNGNFHVHIVFFNWLSDNSLSFNSKTWVYTLFYASHTCNSVLFKPFYSTDFLPHELNPKKMSPQVKYDHILHTLLTIYNKAYAHSLSAWIVPNWGKNYIAISTQHMKKLSINTNQSCKKNNYEIHPQNF